MTVCIDIDNVLSDFIEKAIDFYRNITGEIISMEDITEYNLYECLPKETADKFMEIFSNEDFNNAYRPIEGSQSGLSYLCDKYNVYLVTASSEKVFEWKCSFISRYYPFFNTKRIIRVVNKSMLRAEVLVDDDIQQLITSSCERVCLSYPWNVDNNKDIAYGIYRCPDWSQITKAVDKIYGELYCV